MRESIIGHIGTGASVRNTHSQSGTPSFVLLRQGLGGGLALGRGGRIGPTPPQRIAGLTREASHMNQVARQPPHTIAHQGTSLLCEGSPPPRG